MAGVLASGALVSACGTTATTTLIAPITGIIVRADSLIAGRGCGEADSQVFGYAVTVDVLHVVGTAGVDAGEIALPLAGGSFPCYADGTFANLPTADYAVHVVAFNRKAWDAAGGKEAIDNASVPVADSGLPPPINLLDALHPTWTTECTATQQLNVQVLADCAPLSGTAADGGP